MRTMYIDPVTGAKYNLLESNEDVTILQYEHDDNFNEIVVDTQYFKDHYIKIKYDDEYSRYQKKL